MSEQEQYCFYCECLRAKDDGQVHVQVAEIEQKHGTESVCITSVTVGGDASKCAQFAEMVRQYTQRVLGNGVAIELTPGASGKPN